MSSIAAEHFDAERPGTKVPYVTLFCLTILFCLAIGYNTTWLREEGRSLEEQTILDEEGSGQHRLALLCLGAFAVCSLAWDRRRSISVDGVLGWCILFYVAWTCVSVFWTHNHVLTSRRLIVLAILTVAAFDVARRFSVRHVALLALCITGACLGVSLFAEIQSGSFRPFAGGYCFSGVMHPNTQGVHCAILVLASVALARGGGRQRKWFLVAALTGMIFLILTRSRTAFAAAVLSILFTSGMPVTRRVAVVVTLVFLVSLSLLILGPTTTGQTFLLGKESDSVQTFTGRIPLWQECLRYAAESPLFGYGFHGFWSARTTYDVANSQGWTIPDAHSAYLDVLLWTGSLGLLAFVLMLVLGIQRASTRCLDSSDSQFVYSRTLLVFCACHGLLESSLVMGGILNFLSMVTWMQLGFRQTDNDQESSISHRESARTVRR